MNLKWTSAIALAAMASLSFAQAAHQEPVPVPSSVVGPQLVAWSEMQKPQPVAAAYELAFYEVQSGAVQQSPASPAQDSQPAAQTFTGTIVKDGARYVLKVSKQVYVLDDQERAKSYEGKQVKVNGNLDAKGDMLHVLNIELIS